MAALIAVGALSFQANAHLINPEGILVEGQNDSPEFFNALDGVDDYVLLYKAEYDDGVLGDEEGDYGAYFTIVHPFGGDDELAQISWNLAGSGYELYYVAWKDGNIEGTTGTGKSFAYSAVSDDQRIEGGPEEITTTPPFTGAFSHISFYGRQGESVPDGGASAALLGLGLLALGAARRSRKA